MTRGHIKADTSQEFFEYFFLGHAFCEKSLNLRTSRHGGYPHPLERHNDVLKHKIDLCVAPYLLRFL